jgi:hypothetical protein
MILTASVLRADAAGLNCAEGIVLEWRVGKASLVAFLAQLDFGNKLGLHDFVNGQYRAWIQTPQLLVRGERSEIKDGQLCFLRDDHSCCLRRCSHNRR